MTLKKSVIISGAGIAGLTAAWYFNKLGWRVTVLERAAALRSGGYLISLSGPGLAVARKIGIVDALSEHHRSLDTNVFHNRAGKELWRLSYPKALKEIDWITLPRTTLIDVLYGKVKNKMDINFSSYVQHIKQCSNSTTLTMNDGSHMSCDLFIAADGLRSSARKMLFGSDNDFITPTGYKCAAFQFPKLSDSNDGAHSYGEPGRVTDIFAMDENNMAGMFIWHDEFSSLDNTKSVREQLKFAFKKAHPYPLEIIDQLDDNEQIYLDTIEMVKMPKWHNQRCLLLGDSAHCLTLASGQGASVAMVSAYMLYEALQNSDNIDTALQQHDKRLRPLVESIQSRARKVIKGYVPATKFSFWLRNFIFQYGPKEWISSFIVNSIRKEASLVAKTLEQDDYDESRVE